MIDRDMFFSSIRRNVFGGNMSAGQVLGTTAILDEWEARQLSDERKLANMLATSKWETAHTMQPVRETLAKTDLEAQRNLAGVWYAVPDPITNLSYYGRGLVQLTHKRNYLKMTTILGSRFQTDFVLNPDKVLEMPIAVAIMFEGMLRGDSNVGDFTGLSLEDFFTDTKSDWIGARRVINGTDHDADIADIALAFYAALQNEPVSQQRGLLRYGATGRDVIYLQTLLEKHGFECGPIDGDFGGMTRSAVVAFQEAAGLAADGLVGPMTWAELNA